MNENSKRIWTGLYQIQQENKIKYNQTEEREKERKEREEEKLFHLCTSLMACKASCSLFLFQIKTKITGIKV